MKTSRKHLRASDLRAATQLATEATEGLVSLTEEVHRSVLSTLGLTGAISGVVYGAIRGVTRLVGRRLDALLSLLLESAPEFSTGTHQREAFLAAHNGVMGDHLADTCNPLATTMALFHQGRALDWQGSLTDRILIVIHGLCMNDLQWQNPAPGDVDHGLELARKLGYTVIHVRYNSGLHVSQNGRELADQLEQMAAHWPTPVRELSVLAHSMGGLVTRSAVHYARLRGLAWPQRLQRIVFLGTPHHGAPLERAGNWVDMVLGRTPYSAPFSKLGKLRSRGITDLRYGYVVEEDWRGRDRFHRRVDSRLSVPLPAGVECFAVAATLASQPTPVVDALVGDGLVPVASALGHHGEVQRNLNIAEDHQLVVYGMNHIQLLSSVKVNQQLQVWMV